MIKSIVTMLFMVNGFIQSSAEDNIFWGNHNGKNYLSIMRNQNQPKVCDVSWAFATTTAMGISFNLLKENQFPLVVLSPQMLMNCHSDKFTCDDSKKVSIQKVFE